MLNLPKLKQKKKKTNQDIDIRIVKLQERYKDLLKKNRLSEEAFTTKQIT